MFESSQGVAINTYHGVKPPSKWCDPPLFNHISFSFLLSLPLFPLFHLSLCSYVLVFILCQCSVHYVLDFPSMLFYISPFNINHHIPVFFLCPLEVNLHTYLTTWLCPCPVGIFFGFSPYNC